MDLLLHKLLLEAQQVIQLHFKIFLVGQSVSDNEIPKIKSKHFFMLVKFVKGPKHRSQLS